MSAIVPISKAEIMEKLPDISIKTVELVLSKMVKEKKIDKIGSYKDARYMRKSNIKEYEEEGEKPFFLVFCRKNPTWPLLPANSATLVCGESAAAQGLGALFRNLNRRLWHCRAKPSFRLTAVSR